MSHFEPLDVIKRAKTESTCVKTTWPWNILAIQNKSEVDNKTSMKTSTLWLFNIAMENGPFLDSRWFTY